MLSRIIPNLILSIIWLLVSESRIIIGIYFIINIIFSILVAKTELTQRLLYFLGILAFYPILDSNNLISQFILLFALNFYIFHFSKNQSILFQIGTYLLSGISYIVFNFLYIFAGKILSVISYLGFDNTGHLGLLFAITKKGSYLNPFKVSSSDLGLTFWKYYPQGVVGSISTIIKTLGLDTVDSNKYSFYVIYILFNTFVHLIILYIFFLICKNKLEKLNILQIIFISTIFLLLSLYSFISVFFLNGFLNYTYAIILLEIYILGIINKKSFKLKILILLLILFTAPFIFPIFLLSEIFYLIFHLRNKIMSKRTLFEFCVILLFCSLYLLYFSENWGLEYISTPGFIPDISFKQIIIILTFLLIFLHRIKFKKYSIEEFETVTLSSILIFAILSLITLFQREDVSYYAIKQGYISLILTLLNLVFYVFKDLKSLKIYTFVLLILISYTSVSENSVLNKIKFYNKYGDNSPWIIVNGQSLVTAVAITQLMDYKDYIYVGYYDTDLSSRILNGSISNWNDLNSGLFFGLQGNSNLENIEKQISSLSDLARRLKVPELPTDRDRMLIFYEKNTSISEEISKDNKEFNLYFIN